MPKKIKNTEEKMKDFLFDITANAEVTRDHVEDWLKNMKDENEKIKLKTSQALILKYARDDIAYVLYVWEGTLREDICYAVMETKNIEATDSIRIRLYELTRKEDTLNALFIDDERNNTLTQNPVWINCKSLVCFSEIVYWCLDCKEKHLFKRAEEKLYLDSFFHGWRDIEVCEKLIEELLAYFA